MNNVYTLQGKKGLVVGIANDQSIAWGCARALQAAGAELAVTWLNDKALPHVQPLAQQLGAAIQMPLDVEQPGQLEAVFEAVTAQWGRLDFLLHSIAFAPAQDLHGRVTDSSSAGFARAMDVSCHSFARMARLAEPLMRDGGSLLTMSYLGAAEVIDNYGLMGPVGLADFDGLMADATRRAPLRRLANIDDVGAVCAFLASDGARSVTGTTLYVDAGYHILN